MRKQIMLGVWAMTALAGVFGSGCATIMDGTDQKVPVTSTPPGATVTVDGGATCATPTDLKLSRREEHTLLVSMPGYHTERVTLRREISGAIFGNILIGGIVGGVADLASGASHHLEPKQVNVELQKIKPGEELMVHEWRAPEKETAPEKKQEGATGEAGGWEGAD
jgi:hypothetical protein